MKPSFFALFKRGKYFHAAPSSSNSGTKLLRVRGDTRERERFAAAAIAFSWQHHPRLREHIWDTLCRFRNDPRFSRSAKILVEPEDWADLLIVNPRGRKRFVYVIECKIGAGLLKHQDPTQHAFAKTGGYGKFLVDSDGLESARFRFVVLGLPHKLNLKKRPWTLPIAVLQKFWADFADGFPQTPFASDLKFSLGKLGIGAFPASETKTMKVNTSRSDIGNAVRTLAKVQRRLEWPGGRGSSESFYQRETLWSMGVDLNRTSKSKNSRLVGKLFKSPAHGQIWFGYEGEEGHRRTILAFYAYCDKAATQQQVAKKLREKLRGQLKTFRIKEEQPEKNYYSVTVRTHSNALHNDVDWFCSVFEALGLKPFASDLKFSLGKLGIGAFPASETKTMKVNTSRSDIGNAVRTLAEVQRRLEWPGGRGSSESFYQRGTLWSMGVDLNRTSKSKNSRLVGKLFKSPAHGQIWFGYEGEEGHRRTILAFYAYCDKAATQQQVAKKLREKLRGQLKTFRIKEEQPEKNYYSVTVRTHSNALHNDVDWFCSVFEALGLKLIA